MLWLAGEKPLLFGHENRTIKYCRMFKLSHRKIHYLNSN